MWSTQEKSHFCFLVTVLLTVMNWGRFLNLSDTVGDREWRALTAGKSWMGVYRDECCMAVAGWQLRRQVGARCACADDDSESGWTEPSTLLLLLLFCLFVFVLFYLHALHFSPSLTPYPSCGFSNKDFLLSFIFLRTDKNQYILKPCVHYVR